MPYHHIRAYGWVQALGGRTGAWCPTSARLWQMWVIPKRESAPKQAACPGQGLLEELQVDLDDWLDDYNRTRPHSGKYCYGKTPMQTFLDSLSLAREKMLDSHLSPAPAPERSPAQRSAGDGAAADAAACS